MLKRIINQATIDLTIIPIDPMLIKSGQATVSGVDMSFVRTYSKGKDAEPFIPGSSLKGVIRSYSEKICRSLREKPVPVCLPYLKPGKEKNGEMGQASCGLRITRYIEKSNKAEDVSSADVYRVSCPTCRIFGSHQFIGRLETSDGYLSQSFKQSGKPVMETRDGVAIDRLTGGPVNGAKYDLEVLTRGEFSTRIDIRNFERWQLGLIGLVLRDMVNGQIRIGMGKSRGLGRFEAKVNHMEVAYFGKPAKTIKGISAFCPENERDAYGFFQEMDHENALLPEPMQDGLRFTHDITSQWQNLLDPAVKDFANYIDLVPWPENIDTYMEGGR